MFQNIEKAIIARSMRDNIYNISEGVRKPVGQSFNHPFGQEEY